MCSAASDTPRKNAAGLLAAIGSSGNTTHLLVVSGRKLVLKIYGAKSPRLTYAWRFFLHKAGLPQPIEYRSAWERRDFERCVLQRWKAKGYLVPNIVTSLFPDSIGVPHLFLEHIRGETIGMLLAQEGFPCAHHVLKRLFAEMEARHRSALANNEGCLCHVDANARNIIVVGDVAFHVDFEMGRPWEHPVAWACRENLKLLVSLCEIATGEERQQILTLFRTSYRLPAVLAEMRRGVTGRRWQTIQQWRDRQKKAHSPGKVTLYDIVAAL